MNQPYVVPNTGRRDLFIGLAVGVLLLGLVVFAVMNMSGGVAGSTLTGKIVEKTYVPFEEEQVTFGKKGVHARKTDGEYTLECDVQGRHYWVTVDKATYMSKKVGDTFFFSRPRK